MLCDLPGGDMRSKWQRQEGSFFVRFRGCRSRGGVHNTKLGR